MLSLFEAFDLLSRMALQEKFDEATNTVSKKINKTLTDEELKEVYGLYKQVKTWIPRSIKAPLWRRRINTLRLLSGHCGRREHWKTRNAGPEVSSFGFQPKTREKVNNLKVCLKALSRGGAKWEAWKAVEGVSKEEAQKK